MMDETLPVSNDHNWVYWILMHDLHKRVLYFQKKPEWRWRTRYKQFIFWSFLHRNSGCFIFWHEATKTALWNTLFPRVSVRFLGFLAFIKIRASDIPKNTLRRKHSVHSPDSRIWRWSGYSTGLRHFRPGNRFLYISQRYYWVCHRDVYNSRRNQIQPLASKPDPARTGNDILKMPDIILLIIPFPTPRIKP